MIGRSSVDPGLSEGAGDLGRGLQPPPAATSTPRHVEAMRNMAGAQAGAGLRLVAGKSPGAPRIDDLRCAGRARAQHVGGGGDACGVEARREHPRRGSGEPAF